MYCSFKCGSGDRTQRWIFGETDILVVNEVEAAFYCKTEIDSLDKAKEEIKKTAEKYGNNVSYIR